VIVTSVLESKWGHEAAVTVILSGVGVVMWALSSDRLPIARQAILPTMVGMWLAATAGILGPPLREILIVAAGLVCPMWGIWLAARRTPARAGAEYVSLLAAAVIWAVFALLYGSALLGGLALGAGVSSAVGFARIFVVHRGYRNATSQEVDAQRPMVE